MTPTGLQGYALLLEGAKALAHLEYRGVRVDEEYCRDWMSKLETRINSLKAEALETKEGRKWKSIYGATTNLDSPAQLSRLLFKELGLKPTKVTTKGNAAVDEEVLKSINLPLITCLLEIRRWAKVRGTFLKNLLDETRGGRLHPFYHLHTTVTYRSSSTSPNFQNLPMRDPEIMAIVRGAIRPPPGFQILEIDYSGIEVRVAACYHKDPAMLKYINDPTKDMHRDMASEIFVLPGSEVTKPIRHSAKNRFVFPQFYGDYWKRCAASMWEDAATLNLRDHLKGDGLSSLSKFERHMEKIEDRFWKNRFPVYAKWKDRHYEEYLRRGYFDTLTGFRCSGLMGRNQVINYPVQGSAFHCLLWSLIHLNEAMRKMKSKIVGQIHDSVIIYAAPNELKSLLAMAQQITCHDLRDEWKWIITPLDIEAEATEIDRPWSEKKKVKV